MLVRIVGRDPGARHFGCPHGRRRLVRVLTAAERKHELGRREHQRHGSPSRRSSGGSRPWSKARCRGACVTPGRSGWGIGRRRWRTCCSSPSGTRTPTRTCAVGARAAAVASGAPRGRLDRPPPFSGHGVLPAPAAHTPPGLARALGDPRLPRADPAVVRDPVRGPAGVGSSTAFSRPMSATRSTCMRSARSRPTRSRASPGSRASTRSTSSCPGRAARTAGRRSSAECSSFPPGSDGRASGPSSSSRRSSPGSPPCDREGPGGAAQRHRLGAPLLRPDERVLLPPHRRVPALEPARRGRARAPAGARSRAGARARRVSLRGVTAAAVAVVAGVWALAAYLLWQTTVPSSLHLRHVDTAATFPASVLHRADSYDHVASVLSLLGLLLAVVVFAVYARVGPRFIRDSAAGPIGTGMLLGMLGFGFLWLAEVPFTVLGIWWTAPPRCPRELLEGRARRLARARVRVRPPLRRAADRDGARAARGQLVVAPGGAGVRRARGAVRVRLALPRADAPDRRSAARSDGGIARTTRPHWACPGAGRGRLGLASECGHRGDRPESPRRSLEHAARRALHSGGVRRS